VTFRGALLVMLAGAGLSACATAPHSLAGGGLIGGGQTSDSATASSYSNYLVGRVANLQSDHQAASDRLYRALLASPGDAELMDGVIAASLATGDVERVQAVARMHVSGARQNAYVNIVRGVNAMNAGHFAQARVAFEAAHGEPGANLMARLLQVWARTGEGRVDDVAPELNRLSNMRPYGGLFSFQAAMAFDVSARNGEALAAYQTAEQGGLVLPPGTERHADLLARTGAHGEAQSLLRSALARLANPELEAASARLNAGQPVALKPLTAPRGAAVGLYGLAAIFQQEADTSDALAALTLATMLDPDLDAARLAFAENQSELHHPDAMRQALAHIPETSPYAESGKVMQAWALVDEGRGDDAVALARQTAAAGGVRAKRALADIYRSLMRYSDAEPIYTALIDAEPGDQPQDWRLYFARGAARSQLNRWADAEADLRHALELSPEQPEVLNYLGYSWVDRGEHLQEGLQMIQRAAELRPASGAIIDSLGWAYFKTGRYDLAVDNLEHAVELMPADPLLNDHLGDAYWRSERHIEARFQWQRALALYPMDADRSRIEAKLAHGLPASQTAAR
jgi:tetratricopeptide (TPR) repeat protein